MPDSFLQVQDTILLRDTFQTLYTLTGINLFKDWSQQEIEQFPNLESLLKSITRLTFCDASFLITFYEQTVGNSRAKRQGIFYTPPETALHMVHRAFAPLRAKIVEDSQNFFLLDPACGAGVFLLEAFKELQKVKGLDPSELEKRQEIIEESLFGVDLDPTAIEVSKLSLLLELYGQQQLKHRPLIAPNWNLLTGNSLLDPADLKELPERQRTEFQALNFRSNFPDVMRAHGFDLILGNPPYGLARDKQLSALENKILLKRYADYRDGKLNKYLLFIARGLELLKPDGRMCYIVPNSWLGIRAGRKLRNRFLRQGELESIELLGSDIFREPSLECIIFVAQKQAARKNIEIIAGPSSPSTFPSCEGCLRLPDAIIPLLWSAEIEDFFQILHKNCITLDRHPLGFQPMIALQAYALGKGTPPQTQEVVKEHLFHSRIRQTNEYWPYIEGRDVGRYSCNWSGSFLKHGACLAEPQRLERFSGPRIAIREITAPAPNRLIATYLEDTILYNKSILHILPATQNLPETEKSKRMKALLAILNSKVASIILTLQGRKTQRKLFPKIVNDDLKDFPLPLDLLSEQDKLAELASKRLGLKESQVDQRQIIENEIDHLVLKTYHLPEFLIEALLRAKLSF